MNDLNKQNNYPSWVVTSADEISEIAKHQTLTCLTGMRPSGKLHLGHYTGALENRKHLQDIEGVDCQFLLADYHVMAENAGIETTKNNIFEVVKDRLAVGLDPEKSLFIVQSYLRYQAELKEYISLITSTGELFGNPTLKAELDAAQKKGEKYPSVGFFTYPVSQVADIIGPKADIVPVGADQIPHIELTRKIARKFNKKYKTDIPLPGALLGREARLPGILGEGKMGKSAGNAIYLSDTADTVAQKVKKMYTDPNRLRITDPGNVEANRVFKYLDTFYPDASHLEYLKATYTVGGEGAPGDKELKDLLTVAINDFLTPIRTKRAEYEGQDDYIREILGEGSEKAKEILEGTIDEIRNAMGVARY